MEWFTNWQQHWWEAILCIDLPCDPAVPLLSRNLREVKTYVYIKVYKNFVALFIITKRWKQTKYLPTDEWTNKMWWIHTMDYYYSALKEMKHLNVLQWLLILKSLNYVKWDGHRRLNIVWLHLYEISRRQVHREKFRKISGCQRLGKRGKSRINSNE